MNAPIPSPARGSRWRCLPARWALTWSLALCAGGFGAPVAAKATEALPSALADQADRVVAAVGSPRGICVVLGDPRGELALALARRSELTIFTQCPDRGLVAARREAAEAEGIYGNRLYIEHGPWTRLFLADNLADAVVVTEEAGPVPEAEVLRVLRPQGQAWLRGKPIHKPAAVGADDWSHPYHGPDNNPVSRDRLARGPYLTQFLADPRYAPLPQLAVASAGRVFKVFGHIAFKEREEPWLNTLAAFNGYNGAFLWRRPVAAGLMVHRNAVIATPETVYFCDDKSCQVIDAATGRLRDEIAPPTEVAGGTFWKWMALEDGVLYALIGGPEPRDPVIRMRSDKHGWPWDPLSPGFNQPENPWGYGRTVLALDPKTRRVLWRHAENEAMDSRALCLKNGRLFVFRHGAYLACLDAKTGATLWRKTRADAPDLFEALGPYLDRQDWRTNWRTTAYAKCGEQAVYFAGPAIARLVAVSAADGRMLWQHPYSNYQLVLTDDALYGLSGQIDQEVSRKFDPLTGRVLREIPLGRRACTRPTGSLDAIFCRASDGSTRLDLASDRAQLISPMRAQCQDGVTIANGLLYWWPSVCDCNLTLYGITCLGPAADFDFAQAADARERLEPGEVDAVASLETLPGDWPAFRADNQASSTSSAALATARSQRLWQSGAKEFWPTAPTAVGGFVFYGGSDGVVRAVRADNGKTAWTAFTGGGIRFPPTIWQGRALVGSGDGWVYCFEAKSGRLAWRFRAAPVERRIPVYGQLLSTWPAASGVLVHEGTAYVAAGIVNLDGTHVYALDAATGRLRWQNNTSGHLDETTVSGVSVQGNMIAHQGRLWLAGGNVISPASYDLQTGRCLSDAGLAHRLANNNVPSAESPRGSELYLVADRVLVSDQPFYAHPRWKVYDASVLNKTWVGSTADRDLLWVNNARLLCYRRVEQDRENRLLNAWGKNRLAGADPLWEADCAESNAIALCRNAVVLAKGSELIAYDLASGRRLWTQTIPGVPVPWGLAVDRQGNVLVTLENGQCVCFGELGLRAEAPAR